MHFSKRDLIFSIITGLATGSIVWRILEFLDTPIFFNTPFYWFIIIVPVFWILGVNFGYFLGKRFEFFNQFGKFVAIGFTNAAIDFGVFNLLIFLTGITGGFVVSTFKGVGFIFAIINSYFCNKYWSFYQNSTNAISTSEFIKFFVVSIAGLLVNVGIFSLVVNFVSPLYGLSPERWANVGAMAGSAVALIVTFMGFRLVVFKGSAQKL